MKPPARELEERIARATGAQRVEWGEPIQSLWGGYGELARVTLHGAAIESAIVKIVAPRAEQELAREPAQLRSHRRKLRSYAVELCFYQSFAPACDSACRVPCLLYGEAREQRFAFVLEDLDRAGFATRRSQCAPHELRACLSWLAAFHARFLGVESAKLWPVGSYWHLATRPDELSRLPASELRRAAPRIDARLNSARFRTLVHGDAKLENFCFSASGQGVAAVDFQYVGGGVGVKDVAYLLSCCLSPLECEQQVPAYLDVYFEALRGALGSSDHPLASEGEALENEWRALFPWAWCDFYRFLSGWAPAYAKCDSYGRNQLELVLNALR